MYESPAENTPYICTHLCMYGSGQPCIYAVFPHTLCIGKWIYSEYYVRESFCSSWRRKLMVRELVFFKLKRPECSRGGLLSETPEMWLSWYKSCFYINRRWAEISGVNRMPGCTSVEIGLIFGIDHTICAHQGPATDPNSIKMLSGHFQSNREYINAGLEGVVFWPFMAPLLLIFFKVNSWKSTSNPPLGQITPFILHITRTIGHVAAIYSFQAQVQFEHQINGYIWILLSKTAKWGQRAQITN